MTSVLALATCLMWGLADFGGGLLTRRMPARTVLVVSQLLAVAALGVTVLATGGWSTADARLGYAVAAGLVGSVAQLAFYRALALGPIGVVSPLTALGAVAVPVGAGLVLGERPGPPQLAGMAVALAGVVLVSGARLDGGTVEKRTLALTLVAAFGIGSVMVLIAEASHGLTGVFLALFVQRLCNVGAGAVALWGSARRGAPVLPPGGWSAIRASLPTLAFVGLVDVAANGTYSLAAHSGPVTVAAVLASLYPVVTALAARGVLRERLRTGQAAGAGLALLGTVLVAAG
ncbi:EamA family transporter [Streptomyces sp. CB03238]|uniref:EamA family transporter n=1 Tax=Streptomyces sp. CB03238 TaxID=1907777 RepID=UPI000A0FF542|nr:EamA family transporter [Streptomyces sp. CB03238]ORT56740.1 hypothetical protein BKD26_26550 [Streptomyces sp. CB03238]